MILVLSSGSHDEQLREETMEAPERGEVVEAGAWRTALGVADGKEDAPAMVKAEVCRSEGLGEGVR
jgi:hypothetical protein